jgi:hypothetical protein
MKKDTNYSDKNSNFEIPLLEFQEKEFSKGSPRFNTSRAIAQKIVSDYGCNVVEIRGDGNCFTRCLLLEIYLNRDPNIFFTLLDGYLSESEKNSLINLIGRKDPRSFRDSELVTILCNKLRKLAFELWDYKVDKRYYNDENTIDGPIRESIMRLLCFEKVIVFSLNPGPNDRNPMVFEVNPSKFYKQVSGWNGKLICAQGFCHYSLLV